jgi:uncharacterized protein YndB with AHSA1/START domain
MDTSVAKSTDREVLITRTFDAPRELVFRAWTDRESLGRWFAPHGCTVQFKTFEFRPGGTFLSCIRSPEGHDCWATGTYREIVPPERIVFSMNIADQNGNSVGPADVGMDPEWPRETVVSVTLAEHDGRTTLTLHQTVSETLAKRTGAHPSWLQMLDRLADEVGR